MTNSLPVSRQLVLGETPAHAKEPEEQWLFRVLDLNPDRDSGCLLQITPDKDNGIILKKRFKKLHPAVARAVRSWIRFADAEEDSQNRLQRFWQERLLKQSTSHRKQKSLVLTSSAHTTSCSTP